MYNIIGGSGFVGSKLISVLNKKNCSNLDKNKSPFYSEITRIGDIRKKSEIVITKNCVAIVLLAAEHRDDISPNSLSSILTSLYEAISSKLTFIM